FEPARRSRLARRPALPPPRTDGRGHGHARRLADAAPIKTRGERMHLPALIAATSLIGLAAAAFAAPAPYSPAATATANTGAALRRIRELNPRVNAVLAIDPAAMEQARALDRGGRRGALFGMPILIKDNIESAGPLPTTA